MRKILIANPFPLKSSRIGFKNRQNVPLSVLALKTILCYSSYRIDWCQNAPFAFFLQHFPVERPSPQLPWLSQNSLHLQICSKSLSVLKRTYFLNVHCISKISFQIVSEYTIKLPCFQIVQSRFSKNIFLIAVSHKSFQITSELTRSSVLVFIFFSAVTNRFK